MVSEGVLLGCAEPRGLRLGPVLCFWQQGTAQLLLLRCAAQQRPFPAVV